MEHIVTGFSPYDNRRMRVTLDEGEVAFLLYKGECQGYGIREGAELSGGELEQIKHEILLPRAKKRLLYYLKGGDKSEAQLRRKLKENLYPGDVAEEALAFLEKHGLADDSRFTEEYIRTSEGKRSYRELLAGLSEKGVDSVLARELAEGYDEIPALKNALKKRVKPGSMTDDGEPAKTAAYLMRRGFSYDNIRKTMDEFYGS